MDKEALRGLHGRTWVTREGVHVDRIASAWRICSFIDPEARFKFVPRKGYEPQPGELRFDMFEAEFTHEGDRCTFEVLVERAGLEEPASASSARSCTTSTSRTQIRPRGDGGHRRPDRRHRARALRTTSNAWHAALRCSTTSIDTSATRSPGEQGAGTSEMDQASDTSRSARHRPVMTSRFARGGRGLGEDRRPQLRRAGRADRGDAPHSGRGEALDRRRSVPACAELLHAAAGTGSAASRCTSAGCCIARLAASLPGRCSCCPDWSRSWRCPGCTPASATCRWWRRCSSASRRRCWRSCWKRSCASAGGR